ncbi:MAG TPA: RCC1 repeat-containing protein, partial [Anaerolineae bacterium]|nr:RCC1 repeat-containing protein [Anaerolineae bacterium]
MRDVSQALKGYRRLIAVIMIISLLVSITPFSSTYATTQPVTPMIAAGARHSLALKSDGTVLAWGRNDYGQLGNETTTSSSTPVQVSGLTNVTTVTAGWWHSLALELDGTVWAWGDNRYGQLGNETTTSSSKPVQVSNLSGVVAISSCLGAHSLALKSDGTVWAWGGNWYGQLGDGTTTMYKTTPVQVSGLSGVVAIAAGGEHSLALKQD